MNQLKEKFKVVMLATEKAKFVEKGQIYSNGGDLGVNNTKSESWSDFVPQHLYIYSDKEINEGDWVYQPDIYDNKLYRYTKEKERIKHYCSKIIATTDKSLNLPLISERFVRKYVESQGNINEVMVDMEKYGFHVDLEDAIHGGYTYKLRIKTDKNNHITITRIKDNWNRKEVIEILDKIAGEAISYPERFVTGICFDKNLFNNWIENNL